MVKSSENEKSQSPAADKDDKKGVQAKEQNSLAQVRYYCFTGQKIGSFSCKWK